MNKLFAFAALSLLSAEIGAQTLSGTVRSAATQEALAGANLRWKNASGGGLTDQQGRFAINNLPADPDTLVVSYLGYRIHKEYFRPGQDQTTLKITLEPREEILEAVDVDALRAQEETPMAHQTLSRKEIQEFNQGRDLPYVLEQTPSMVTTSDAGAGIGYTSMRIRGSDQTRINVTINGIPVNDAESQGVFWVNMPDLASSLNSVQIQRGVGTSTNGAGAFGASVNLETETFSRDPYAQMELSGGSFNTRRATFRFGTGLIKDKWSFDGRLSRIRSDGYLDRASSDLASYYFSGGYAGENTSLKFITFSGSERTYQAWNGVHKDSLATNPTFNSAGAIYDTNGQITGYYPNEVDNYRQTHYQLHFNHNFSPQWRLHVAGYYTKGAGFFEQYRQNAAMADYQLSPVILGSDTITQTDLVRRPWLDNDLYGSIYSLRYQNGPWELVTGGGYNEYYGDHFGEIIWARYASQSQPEEEFYFNDAVKTDWNHYLKAYYQATSQLTLFADLQGRVVTYRGQGTDRGLNNIDFDDQLPFFNPKAGAQYQINELWQAYASVAVAHREPARRDYIENLEKPRPERLVDYEGGVRFHKDMIRSTINLYYMDYYDQLVLTGELTDVGYALRQNVGRSYRTGIEWQLDYRLAARWQIQANATWSMNRNRDWRVETTDDQGQPEVQNLGETPIALSPDAVAGLVLSYEPLQGMKISAISKYVGRQYLDNTGNADLTLDPYLINDLRLIYQWPTQSWGQLGINLLINNITGNLLREDGRYANNGYTWGPQPYIYPQAPTNFLAGISWQF